jgi:integrase
VSPTRSEVVGRSAHVPIPAALLDELGRHLDQFAQRVFVGGKGGMLRRQNFRKIWLKAVAESGVPEVHFHDLRHTGNTLVAENSATVRR